MSDFASRLRRLREWISCSSGERIYEADRCTRWSEADQCWRRLMCSRSEGCGRRGSRCCGCGRCHESGCIHPAFTSTSPSGGTNASTQIFWPTGNTVRGLQGAECPRGHHILCVRRLVVVICEAIFTDTKELLQLTAAHECGRKSLYASDS